MAITVSKKEMESIFTEYAENRSKRDEIEVTFDDLNEPNPLEVLRLMDNKPETGAIVKIAESMCDGHSITFTHNGNKIKSIAYNKGSGNSLALMLSDAIYLLDALTSVIYALLLKKLTPHLADSN